MMNRQTWLVSAAVLLAGFGVLAAEPVPLGSVASIQGVAVDPKEPQRPYLATHHGLYRANPDGTAERISSHHDDLMGFTPHPKDPNTFFASGHRARGGSLGFMVSTDGGVSWRQISPGLKGPVDFHAMSVSRSDPDVIYGIHAGEVQRSRDGGKTWEVVGSAPDELIDLAVAPEDPTTLYAATETGLLMSRDAGRSWGPAMTLRQPVTMVESAADGNVYAYVVGTGLMRRDRATWSNLGTLGGERGVLYFATAPDRFYAITDDDEILVSRDGGRTWLSYGG